MAKTWTCRWALTAPVQYMDGHWNTRVLPEGVTEKEARAELRNIKRRCRLGGQVSKHVLAQIYMEQD